MTPSEFFSIAPLFISEDDTRRALCSAFRHGHHLFASDGCVMGGGVDYGSPWLVENLTPSQRDYAMRLAIERKEWRNR